MPIFTPPYIMSAEQYLEEGTLVAEGSGLILATMRIVYTVRMTRVAGQYISFLPNLKRDRKQKVAEWYKITAS